MFEFIAAVIVFGMMVFAMSLGVIFRNRPLKSSCGGLNNLKKLLGITPCEGCKETGTDCPLRKLRELQKQKVKDAGGTSNLSESIQDS